MLRHAHMAHNTMYCIVTNTRTMKFVNNNQTRQGYKGVGV
jgi:hypothetical protein